MVIHREDLFFARNISISCISAPIDGPTGQLVGALDVSSARRDQTTAMNRVIAAVVSQTACGIEVDGFRQTYAKARIVMMPGDDADANTLLAVDKDDLVVGATRKARRKKFPLGNGRALEPRLASELLSEQQCDPAFERAERTTIAQTLAQAGSNASEAARRLGIGRATLYRRMSRLNIPTRN